MTHESVGNTNCQWHARNSHQWICRWTGGLKNKRTSGEHLHYNIVVIDQNMKSPGNLRRLAVTQNPVENHQLTLV